MLDGRRIWLVSGAIHYARTPSEQWADRIRAAKAAGLNTVSTPVVWAEHEPRPGQFDFKGDRDLRRFIKAVGEEGMHCVINVGPYIGSGWDFGGMPAWLSGRPEMRLRAADPAFLEPTSRFLTAVADQIKGLQVSSPGKGGPVLLVELESNWVCGHQQGASAYLGELDRYLREAGLSVPVINSSNLWQQIEGQIDAWCGTEDLLSVMRQLSAWRGDQPRLVVDFYTQPPAWWGGDAKPLNPWGVQRRLAEILAGGGQYNLAPFHGGTNFGFNAGRLDGAPDQFAVTSNDMGSPLAEWGGPGHCYHAVRRISTFASQFGRVLANLDPQYQPVLLDPQTLRGPKRGGAVHTAVHVRGSQGSVAFVFAPDPEGDGAPKGGSADLLLPDGGVLPVHLGSQAVAWCLFDVKLTHKCHLDYCSLNAFAMVGEAFVCFGAAGQTGLVSVNGSPLEIEAPKGRKPLVTEIEGLTVVVCNEEQIDMCWLDEDAARVGLAWIDPDGTPRSGSSSRTCTRIGSDGSVSNEPVEPARTGSKRPTLGEWERAGTDEYLDGTSPRYAAIDGPASLSELGSPYGYGWYRLTLRSSSSKRTKVALPEAGDRLQLRMGEQDLGVIGLGPGAEPPELNLQLRKGEQDLVVLAENLGRFSAGDKMGEPKGLWGHLWDVSVFRAGKASVEVCEPIEPLAHRSPIWEVRDGDVTLPHRATWSFMHRRKSPLFMSLDALPARALLMLNDEVLGVVGPAGPRRLVLTPEQLRAGKNVVQLAPLAESTEDETSEDGAAAKALIACVSFQEGTACLTGKSGWAFAKWEPPASSGYEPAGRLTRTGQPTWWRSNFEIDALDQPVYIDTAGLSKGQLYVNGRHVGRYFTATASGKTVGPQTRLFVPAPVLREGGTNEVVVFDEHGATPSKVRVLVGTAPGGLA